ncbi:hypothetical protein BDR07DRAFT_1382456 [Suillus spraguei]|nr:hypothetical protein BDR07DRAFT_1382456 [Suillus spraguei]
MVGMDMDMYKTSIHTTAETLKGTLAHSKQLHDAMEQEKEEDKNDFKTAAEHIEDVVDTLYESIEDCNNSYKLLMPSLEFTQDRLNNLATQLSQPHQLSRSQQPHLQPSPPTAQ